MYKKCIIIGCEPVSMLCYWQLRAKGLDAEYFIDPEMDGVTEAEGRMFLDKPAVPAHRFLYENRTGTAVFNSLRGNESVKELMACYCIEEDPELLDLCEAVCSRKYDLFDPLTGYAGSGDVGSFRIYGEKGVQEKKFRLVIVGGAASDPYASFTGKHWTEILHNMLEHEGLPNVIYNGSVSGYTSCEEKDIVLRDVPCLEPDLVLSFSGASDISPQMKSMAYPWYSCYTAGRFRRILKEHTPMFTESWFEEAKPGAGYDRPYSFSRNWLDHQRIMYSVLKGLNIPFCGFLQPSVFNSQEGNVFYREVRKEILQKDFLYDLSEIFDRKSDSFMDGIYYTEQGSRIVAEKVCRILLSLPYIRK